MIIYAIIVLKSIIYDIKFLFLECPEGVFIIDIRSTRVLALCKDKKFVAINKIKIKIWKLDSVIHDMGCNKNHYNLSYGFQLNNYWRYTGDMQWKKTIDMNEKNI